MFNKKYRYWDYIIFASPKSGTTWMQNILSNHPDAVCAESRAFGDFFDPAPYLTTEKYFNILSNYHRIQSAGIKISNDEFYKKLFYNVLDTIAQTSLQYTGKSVYGEKLTPYVNTAENAIYRISEYNPKIKFVNLIRDGRDVIASASAQWYNNKIRNAGCLEEITLYQNKLVNREILDDVFDRCINNWIDAVKSGLKAKDIFVNYYELRYEKLLCHPDDEIKNLFDFLKIKNNKSIVNKCIEAASFERLCGGRKNGEEDINSFYRKGIDGDWVNWFNEKHEKMFVDKAGDLMRKSGYTLF